MPRAATNTIDKGVGERIRARRVELKLTQSALAKAIGVTFQQVQKYENGKNRIGAGSLGPIAEFLGVSTSYLLGEAGADGQPGFAEAGQAGYEASDPAVAREAMALHRAFLRIASPELRRSVIDLVTKIAAQPAETP
ncbi:MAG: helix-turn-helix transcriptional regulator [Rhizobiales bacterium]|nr:helix-turn-helix transcriptional regulator [Hyphomicrobiales bacterium]